MQGKAVGRIREISKARQDCGGVQDGDSAGMHGGAVGSDIQGGERHGEIDSRLRREADGQGRRGENEAYASDIQDGEGGGRGGEVAEPKVRDRGLSGRDLTEIID